MRNYLRKALAILMAATMAAPTTALAVDLQPAEDLSRWNETMVTANTADHLYTNFPVQVDNRVDNAGNLTLTFQYLKTLGANAEARLSIYDFNTQEELFNEAFSDYGFIKWEEAGLEKTYAVVVTETFGTEVNRYGVVLQTQNQTTDFPVNLTLNGIPTAGGNGIADEIMLLEAGFTVSCEHGEEEECTDACTLAHYIRHIPESEFATFYGTLAPNKLYEVQVNAELEGVTKNYRGFISTYPGEAELGVFRPGYALYQMSMEELETKMQNGDMRFDEDPDDEIIEINGNATGFDDLFVYEMYETRFGTLSSSQKKFYIKWVVPEDGDYQIETIGNVNTMMLVYNRPDESANHSVHRDGGTGGNVKYTTTTLAGNVNYFVIQKEGTGSYGEFGFKITPLDYSRDDTQTNFIDIAEANYKAGGALQDSNENANQTIDYKGDIDIFALKGYTGRCRMELQPLDSDVMVDVYTVAGQHASGRDMLWLATTYSAEYDANNEDEEEDRRGAYITDVTGLSNACTYFFVTKTDKSVDVTSICRYNFNFYPANYRDALERGNGTIGHNNGPTYASPLTIGENIEATISMNDADWFTFNVTEVGRLSATMTKTRDGNLYNMALYHEDGIELDREANTWTLGTPLATGIANSETNPTSKTLSYNFTLDQPSSTYYLYISRPNNNTYDAHPYTGTYTLSTEMAPVCAAQLSGNVALTHTVGTTITSLDAMLNTVMEKLTCTENNTVIPSATAKANVTLLYNNAALTPEIVNGLSAGTYTLTAQYKDVAATGGTITLTVSEAASDDKIELTGITKVRATASFLDWAAAAKTVADARLVRESQTASTLTVVAIARAIKGNDFRTRGTAAETAYAANYVYCNDQDSMNFIDDTVSISSAEGLVYNNLAGGTAMIIQLTSATTPSDMSLARYLVVCGINRTTHQYQIIDPLSADAGAVWVDDTLLLNGGYDGNSDLRFTGTIIELY